MNWVEIITKTLFGTVEVFGMVLLIFAVFRIHYSSYFKELLTMSFVISITQTFGYDILFTPPVLNESVVISLTFIFLMMLAKFSAWISFLLSVCGYVIHNICWFFYAILLEQAGIANAADAVIYNDVFVCIIQFSHFIVGVIVASIFYKNGYGFLLIKENLRVKPEWEKLNRLIISMVLISLLGLWETLLMVSRDTMYVQLHVILIFLLITFDIALWSIYKRSNKEIEERTHNTRTFN